VTKASEKRKARRRRNKVVPLKKPKGDLSLTDLEKVTLENFLLKLETIRIETDARKAAINAEKEALIQSIEKRLGISRETHSFDLDTGAVSPKQRRPKRNPKTNKAEG
jgi:hypothetical protein